MHGLLTEETKELLKKSYPRVVRYSAMNGKHDFVFIPLNQQILDKIRDFLSQTELKGPERIERFHQLVYDQCVVWPKLTMEEKKTLPLGIVPSISKAIHESSEYVSTDITGRILGPTINVRMLQDFDYWPDITDDELTDLKRTYPMLTHVMIGKWCFVMRPMNRSDIQISSAALDPDSALVKSVVVWPHTVDWNQIPNGVVMCLGNAAESISGWEDPDNIVLEDL